VAAKVAEAVAAAMLAVAETRAAALAVPVAMAAEAPAAVLAVAETRAAVGMVAGPVVTEVEARVAGPAAMAAEAPAAAVETRVEIPVGMEMAMRGTAGAEIPAAMLMAMV